MAGWSGGCVGKFDFDENPAVSQDFDFDFGLRLRVCQKFKRHEHWRNCPDRLNFGDTHQLKN